ncbi:hypothetical protein BJY04DRAFT_181038 [Aspergillus karnatakaensis]|uniref:Zn(II)2Cys6 transcription factor domain-containing protein n=1 Tax=Aspergillus karnatakaensis TaxID=1810916 RepID=UPI003CCD59CF
MPAASPRAFQTTFQISLPDGPSGTPYHARRSHKKSRKGCLVCKTRRVKCDEQKPSCRRCMNYGASCSYPSPSTSPSRTSGSPESSTELSNMLVSLSISEMTSKVRKGVGDDLAFAPRVIGDYDTVFKLAVDSFQWFLSNSSDTVAPGMIKKVMMREMIHVAFDNPYLMYTLLGCGVLHMNRMCPLNKPRELAEAYFWQRALALYSQALQKKVDETSIDGLISACMLIGVTSVCPPNFEIQDSFVFTGRHSDLNWLAIQGGLACILKHAAKYVPGSIWGPPFGRNQQFETELFKCHVKQGREGIHPGLADLCEITETTSAETSPYYFPLKILTPYLELEANAENATHCATWMGRIGPEFVNMCRERDQRALVILAYWMGLMCTLSEWQPWIEGRIRNECIAICIYLESEGDPIIYPYLEFPASAAGYTLQNLL